MNKEISVVLLGAGKSKRFKSNILKQNYKIKNKSVITYSRDFFLKYFPNSNIYIVINDKVFISNIRNNEYIIYGSSSRLKSLNNCLDYIHENKLQTKYTLIHDVARPILNIKDIQNIITEIKKNIDASTLGYPISNAIKEVKKHSVNFNISRDNLWSSFTPQIFKTDKLLYSIQSCIENKYKIDDDVEALILNNFKCSIVLSSPLNIKITYLSDINHIKRLL